MCNWYLHFVVELSFWYISTVSTHRHLDCGTCLCTFTRSSSTLLMNCGGENSTVVRVRVVPYSSLWRSPPKSAVAHAHGRSVRRFTLAWASSADNVFAGVFIVTHCETRSPSCVEFWVFPSPNPSVDVFPRNLTVSPSGDNWSSFFLWLLCVLLHG